MFLSGLSQNIPHLTKKQRILIGTTFLLIGLPVIFLLATNNSDKRSRASSINSLETEIGVITGNVTLQNDPQASGGKFIKFSSITSSLLPVGQKQLPCSGITINPGDDIQAKINANPENGLTFCFKPGIHRLTTKILPKEGQKYIGEYGAILNGSKDITNQFAPSGNVWSAANQTAESPPVANDHCKPGYTRCGYNEDVYYDNTLLKHVSNVTAVTPGSKTFFFDYATNTISISENPVGHLVEVAIADGAIKGAMTGITNLTFSNFIVEKFANPAQAAAVDSRTWIIENNEVRFNHGVGIRGGGTVTGNYIHHNGELGIGGSATLVENNEIAFNNTAGFAWGWEGGGSKWTHATDMILRGNYVHDNDGPGLWCDGDCYKITYENNRIENNYGPGIDHEISYDATIRNNTLKNNAIDARGKSLYYGAAIYLGASFGYTNPIEIYGNTIDDNANGIGFNNGPRLNDAGRYGGYGIKNVSVHDNTIKMKIGQTGITSEAPLDRITFQNNTYFLGTAEPYFQWQGPKTTTQWKQAGNDTTGNFSSL